MKPHLSPTQLETYTRCPEQYRRRYLDKDIIPPGIALMKGSGFHRAVAVNMRQKIESHQDLTAEQIKEIAASEFETVAAGGYILTEDEQGQGSRNVLGRAKDQTVGMAEFHAVEQAPSYQPILVEEKVLIELPRNSHDLLGILDLADDQDAVTDFKTASRRKSKVEADTSIQLTTYAAAFQTKTGRPTRRVALDVVVQGREFSRQLLESERSGADFAALAARVDAVTQAINAGIFPPTSPGAWWCSARWCGYFNHGCPYVNHERKQAENGEQG